MILGMLTKSGATVENGFRLQTVSQQNSGLVLSPSTNTGRRAKLKKNRKKNCNGCTVEVLKVLRVKVGYPTLAAQCTQKHLITK